MHRELGLLLAAVLLVGATGACSGRTSKSVGSDKGGVGGAAPSVSAQAGYTSEGGRSDGFVPCPTAVPTEGEDCFLGEGAQSRERCTYSVPGCEQLVDAVCSMGTWQLEACPGTGGIGPGPDPSGCSAGQRCVSSLSGCDGISATFCYCVEVADCEPRVSNVCGCDGQVYESDCAAYQAGTSLSGYAPACGAPPGTFRCGYTFCALGELCVERYENGWQCLPLPEPCQGQVDCNCLAGAGGAGGEGGVSPDWSTIAADRGCRDCADDGPGLKVKCDPY